MSKIPLGTVIESVAPPAKFLAADSKFVSDPENWIHITGDSFDAASALANALGSAEIPGLRFKSYGQYLVGVISFSATHGEEARPHADAIFGNDPNIRWHWIVGNADTAGCRDGKSRGHWEWSEDNFEHGIDAEGRVVARGRTYDYKVGGETARPPKNSKGWSKWNNGSANVTGIGIYAGAPTFRYLKIN